MMISTKIWESMLLKMKKILSSSDIIVQLGMLSDDKTSIIKENQTLIGVFNPYTNKKKLESLAKKK